VTPVSTPPVTVDAKLAVPEVPTTADDGVTWTTTV
jgi:hypothetical protein